MKTRFTSTLLTAVTVLGLGVAPALAASPSAIGGYEFPDFWGTEPAQQAPSAQASNRADGPGSRHLRHADEPWHLAVPAQPQRWR